MNADIEKIDTAVKLILGELSRATEANDTFHSAHEGYAVILEELDELKAEVWKRRVDRDRNKMLQEAVQVGAMAMRFIVDVCLEGTHT